MNIDVFKVIGIAVTQNDLSILTAIFQVDLVSRYRNAYILDFIGGKGDRVGGDN